MQCENIKAENPPKKLDLPEGVPPLTSLYFYISGSCNLACKHCWIAPDFTQDPANGKFVKVEYVDSAIKQAKPLGLRSVKLTGGEPLLHPEFKEIVSVIRKEKIAWVVETNGILIDEPMAGFLAEGKSKPFISVSIDGSRKETHDDLRGVKGSFEKSTKAIKHLVDKGIHPQIICSLHKGNFKELEQVVEMAGALDCESVKFNLIQEIGRGSDYRKKFGLSIEKILELYNYTEDSVIPHSKTRVFFDIPFAFYPVKRFLRGNGIGKCQVYNILGMLSTGELSLCGIGTTVSELIYGHIDGQELKNIWCESPGLSELRKSLLDEMDGICNNCIHKNFCMATCVANNYVRTGRLNSSYYFCEEAERLGLFPGSRKKGVANGKKESL